MKRKSIEREYDFTLVIDGVDDLTDEVAGALFESGCDDATFSMQYGRLCADFSRRAQSPQEAILGAIRDIRRAKIGASVSRVDDCDLVTQADIARRTGRSRQQVSQFIKGTRGPGQFPPPECHLGEGALLWRWCAVSAWLAEHNIIRPEELWNAKVIAAINAVLELSYYCKDAPDLVREIRGAFPGELCLV